tara:strand:- start:238 stop:978 length:741 start_codon:yes stop_codon:yes gene_type:complete
MAQIRDLDAGKIYIGQENPKLDRSLETLDGDKEYEGTLAVTGPTFIGGHSTNAAGVLNVGTALGTFSPNTDGRAVDIEGDVNIVGEKAVNTVFIDGDVFVTGSVDCLSKGRLEARHAVADSKPKPFDMVHPSKGEGHRLRYACIEGPEVGVYFRGRTQDNEIVLPDYWKDLVVIDSITVQTQPVGSTQNILVKEWDDSKIILEGVTDCFYHVYAERKDVNPLVVEYDGETWQDYPDPDYNDSSYAR